jgi:hypothetical protein
MGRQMVSLRKGGNEGTATELYPEALNKLLCKNPAGQIKYLEASLLTRQMSGSGKTMTAGVMFFLQKNELRHTLETAMTTFFQGLLNVALDSSISLIVGVIHW